MADADDYITIYRPDVFDCFRLGSPQVRGQQNGSQRWFATCLAYQYEDIAKRHACEVRLSPTRMEEARLLWMRDTDRIDIDGDTTPDHFKQVGFLVYWLRRRFVAAFCQRNLVDHPSVEQDKFMLCANEACAFMIGFRLSLYFEMKNVVDIKDDVGSELQELSLDSALKFDIATLLRHKNVSPHSLYLIYRTLFHELKKPRRTAPVLALVPS